MRHTLSWLLVALAATSVSLSAADLTALISAAAQAPVQDLKPAYAKAGPIALTFDSSPNITRRLASGEMPDILVAQPSTIDEMVKAGRAIASTRTIVGKSGVGVAIGKGWKGATGGKGGTPDISSADALKALILNADSVVYSRGASGALVENMFRKLGVAEQVKNRLTAVERGAEVMQRMGETGHGDQIGFTMTSEIKLGESGGGKLVGPLPAALQVYTPYEAIVMSSAKSPDAAKAFIAAITTPAAHKVFAAAGWN
jgi:molybdate transport system substrate-binding protein